MEFTKKKQYIGEYRGDCLKGEVRTVCKFIGWEGLARKRGGSAFEGEEVDTPMHTMYRVT